MLAVSRKVGPILAIAAAAVFANTARADVLITASVDGGAPILLTINASDPPTALGTFSGGIGDIYTVGFASTGGTQTALRGDQVKVELFVTQVVSGNHTLTLLSSVSDFTAPPGPNVIASSSFSGTVAAGTTAQVDYAAYINDDNGLGHTDTLIVAGTTSASGGLTTAPLLPPVDGFINTTETPAYSLTMVETFHTHARGATVNTAATTSVLQVSAVPEPSTVALAIAGLPMLIGGAWLRKRRAHA